MGINLNAVAMWGTVNAIITAIDAIMPSGGAVRTRSIDYTVAIGDAVNTIAKEVCQCNHTVGSMHC